MFTKHILINYLLKEEEFWFSCNLFGNRFQNSSTVGYGGVAQLLGCRLLAVNLSCPSGTYGLYAS